MSTRKESTSLTYAKKSLTENDTEIALNWLANLTEEQFRDDLLEHLFTRMRKSQQIKWFKNIHGRTDKGVDFLVIADDGITSRSIGIQAKSKPIERNGRSPSLSALNIIRECQAALTHEFNMNGTRGRLDNIELWISSHITQDAYDEFSALGIPTKIPVKRASDIYGLIERHAPEYLRKIPSLALSVYIKKKQNPETKPIRMLGSQLNPKEHFLEPIFAKAPAFSVKSLVTRKQRIEPSGEKLSLKDILFSDQHYTVIASELSGKSYLLNRAEFLAAENGYIPVALKVDQMKGTKRLVIERALEKELDFLDEKEIGKISEAKRIVILIDDIDRLDAGVVRQLFELEAKRYKILATSKTWHGNGSAAYLVGVDLACIPNFLRSLDKSVGVKLFADRAHAFIHRTLESSGLASNPFTIAVMLSECHSGATRFSTPTLGRLIERFIELQLGSHSDFEHLVDFETKREFLTKMAARHNGRWAVEELRRSVIRFIERGGHPHSASDFCRDLFNAGVLKQEGGYVVWSHPVIAEYFWVKNLVGRRLLKPIVKLLVSGQNVTLSAVVGSQLQNADELLSVLCTEVERMAIEAEDYEMDRTVALKLLRGWASGAGEEELLAEIEKEGQVSDGTDRKAGEDGQDKKSAIRIIADPLGATSDRVADKDRKKSEPERQLSREEKEKLKRDFEGVVQRYAAFRGFLAFNIAAVLVNGRDSPVAVKQKAIRAVLRCNRHLGDMVQAIARALVDRSEKFEFMASWTRLFFQLHWADRFIGDPFLVNVFKRELKLATDEMDILALLDLGLCCGEENYDEVIQRLEQIDRLDMTFALYVRVVGLYYFRFHRERERKVLREFLKRMRRIHSGVMLPSPV